VITQRDRSNVRERRRHNSVKSSRTALRCATRLVSAGEGHSRIVVGTIRQHVAPRYRAENRGQIKHGDSVAVYGADV